MYSLYYCTRKYCIKFNRTAIKCYYILQKNLVCHPVEQVVNFAIRSFSLVNLNKDNDNNASFFPSSPPPSNAVRSFFSLIPGCYSFLR